MQTASHRQGPPGAARRAGCTGRLHLDHADRPHLHRAPRAAFASRRGGTQHSHSR